MFPIEPPWTPDGRDFLLTETFETEDRYIESPTGPGLGVEIEWDIVEERS